jgi:LEA14-like dessication related protein
MTKTGKIIIGLLIGAIVGIIVYLLNELNKISKAPLEYAGFKINSASISKVDLTAFFKLNNTGSLDIMISDQEYDVYINDKFVSRISNPDKITIAPGENILPNRITFTLADVLKAGIANLSYIISDRDKVNISLKGKRSMKIGFISFNNVEINEVFNLGSI